MADSRNSLQSMFGEASRFANFGDMLMQMHVRGFRCHGNTVIDVTSPIMAFCGLNGTGKSTLLQLAAVSRGPATGNSDSYVISDFFVIGTLDIAPVSPDASVQYRFWQEDRSLKQVTLTRKSAGGWDGYRRRPKRAVMFAGVGHYLPKIEQRDFIVRKAGQLTVERTQAVAERIKTWTCKVLGQTYDQIMSNTVTHAHLRGEVISVERAGYQYSEAHMGCGEGRIQFFVNHLETLPDRSLVLLEEPETSLHPSAQYCLGEYLVDVAREKKHQIFLTTHSEFILQALPAQSRVYLHWTPSGIQKILGLTSLQAKSLMTDGYVKALHVLVEDDCAKTVLAEIIRRSDATFLKTVGIHPIGDKDVVHKAVQSLKETGLPVAAVRDGDKQGDPKTNIFKLPGSLPPEKELFQNAYVKKYIQARYGINLDNFQTRLIGVNHHDWFRHLAEAAVQDEAALVAEAASEYVASLSELEGSSLITLLKEASNR